MSKETQINSEKTTRKVKIQINNNAVVVTLDLGDGEVSQKSFNIQPKGSSVSHKEEINVVDASSVKKSAQEEKAVKSEDVYETSSNSVADLRAVNQNVYTLQAEKTMEDYEQIYRKKEAEVFSKPKTKPSRGKNKKHHSSKQNSANFAAKKHKKNKKFRKKRR